MSDPSPPAPQHAGLPRPAAHDRAAGPHAAARRVIGDALEPWWRAADRAFRTVLAVSGGPDSVALLRITAMLVELEDLPPERFLVGHVQHGLRGAASERDAEFVQALAAQFGFHCEIRRVPPGALPSPASADSRKGQSLEGEARRWRYRLLAESAAKFGARLVATGHHLDDHIETVAMRVLRGTGLRGLAGVPGQRTLADGVTLIRPLRGLRRQQLQRLLQLWAADSCQDATNDDLSLTRNRIRYWLQASQNKFAWPVDQALVHLSVQAADVLELLARQTAPLQATTQQRPGGFAIQQRLLVPYSRSELIYWLQEIWLAQGWPQQQMHYEAWRNLAAWLVAPASRTMPMLPGRIHAMFDGERIVVQRLSDSVAASSVDP